MALRPRGRLVVCVIAVGAATVAATVCAADPLPTPAADAARATDDADATTRWSRNRVFAVSYVSDPSPVPLLKIHSWTITVRDAAGNPVPDARVTVLGGMPAHGHGLPTAPQVQNLGGGRYLIEGLKFHMPGAWVVGFRIKDGPRVDSVNFDLQLD
jgi:hypothetical protein